MPPHSSSFPRETEEMVVTETHTHLAAGPLNDRASISLPHTTNPVTPFRASMSLQPIIALNWKEGGAGGAQVFYKEQRNLLTENRTEQAASADWAAGRAKKEVNWGAQRQVQSRHCFQISSCE